MNGLFYVLSRLDCVESQQVVNLFDSLKNTNEMIMMWLISFVLSTTQIICTLFPNILKLSTQ